MDMDQNRFNYRLFFSFSVAPFLALLCLLLIFPVKEAKAGQSHLMLNPIRLIFNGRDRTAQLSVINPGEEEVRYGISVVPLRKKENGEWVLPKDTSPEDKKISNMIRYSPRRAKIPPKTEQVVRFMLRKPANLQTGEYRARIILSPMPEKKEEISASDGFSVSIGFRVQSSFPLIIQHNIDFPTVTPISIALPNGADGLPQKMVEVEYQRQGKYSSFGDVTLLYNSKKLGSGWREIGRAKGLAIYSPKTRKKISIALHDISKKELQNGLLRLEYRRNNGREKSKKTPDSVRDFRL